MSALETDRNTGGTWVRRGGRILVLPGGDPRGGVAGEGEFGGLLRRLAAGAGRGGTRPASGRASASTTRAPASHAAPRSGSKPTGGADTRTSQADPCAGLGSRVVLDGFDLNGATAKPAHQAAILQVARCIAASQKTSRPIRSVRVVGHTGPEGPSAHNTALGLKRAQEVRRLLAEALERAAPGSSGRVTLTPENRGDREPATSDPAKRRRVEILLPLPDGKPSGTRSSPTRFSQSPTPTSPPAVPAGLLADLQWYLKNIPGVAIPKMPTALRYLDPAEENVAKGVYLGSLDLKRILISDGLGVGNKAFTVALKSSGTWYVVMNMGSLRSRASKGRDSELLVHELAHAWQSQHHSRDPQAFMWNSLKNQARAVAAQNTVGLLGGKYSAYAYIPGKRFGEYAAEQIAQQVEHAYARRGKPTPVVMTVIQSVGPGARSAENEQSLTVWSHHNLGEPGVVSP